MGKWCGGKEVPECNRACTKRPRTMKLDACPEEDHWDWK